VDGMVYFGSLDHNIYALDAETGNLEWEFETGYDVKSSPAVVDGRLYTGCDDGYIHCLDANTGSELWNYEVGGPTVRYFAWLCELNIRSSPTIYEDKLYVGHMNGYIYCLDAITGHLIWERDTGGEIYASPAVADGAVYINSNTPYVETGTLFKLDADSGNIIWTLEIPYSRPEAIRAGYKPNYLHWFCSPTVGDGMVFIAADGRLNYCIDATTSQIIWQQYPSPLSEDEESLIPNAAPMIYDPGQPYYKITGTTEYFNQTWPYRERFPAEGRVYSQDYCFNLVGLNASDGDYLWNSWTTREVYGFTYGYKLLYVDRHNKVLSVYDADTGRQVSYWETGSQMWSNPILYMNKVYLGCFDWKLYCFDEGPSPTTSDTTYYGP
jgi:outer membrane protein assembly factor BamB